MAPDRSNAESPHKGEEASHREPQAARRGHPLIYSDTGRPVPEGI
jgi:hypothetical protein